MGKRELLIIVGVRRASARVAYQFDRAGAAATARRASRCRHCGREFAPRDPRRSAAAAVVTHTRHAAESPPALTEVRAHRRHGPGHGQARTATDIAYELTVELERARRRGRRGAWRTARSCTRRPRDDPRAARRAIRERRGRRTRARCSACPRGSPSALEGGAAARASASRRRRPSTSRTSSATSRLTGSPAR